MYRVINDQWGYYVTQDGVGEIAFFKGSSAKENAQQLCAKLNRLAALEAVCGEIVKDGSQITGTMSESFVTGVKTADYAIKEKLKAVLEEKQWEIIMQDGQ